MQVQVGQFGVQAVQPRDKPARQQAARTGQQEGRLLLVLTQRRARLAQPVEGIAAGIAQLATGGRQADAAPSLAEQGDAELVFKLTNLPADRAVGDVQLTRRLTHAFQPGSGFEGAQSV